ncbi:MAG: type I-B CRISPR-associated protein Cas7/Csh2 [Promethearchaeota archaeon]
MAEKGKNDTENENILKNRVEIVFIYDVRDANPNGDPDNSNLPRMDDETGENIVTDLRLKRTIRDYWLSHEKDVLIRPVMDEKGKRKTMGDLVLQELEIEKVDDKNKEKVRQRILDELPKKFLDVRAFGAAVTLPKANVSITGTVQFGLGRSLNKPEIRSLTITTTLASTEEKGTGTIGEYHILDYSLIKFHGIVSEINAKETGFSENDLIELYKALWEGTLQINTRSKFNHVPRLCIAVVMNENLHQIGDLDLKFELYGEENPNSIDKVKLNASEFLKKIDDNKDDIKEILIKIHEDLNVVNSEGKSINLKEEINKFSIPVSDLY